MTAIQPEDAAMAAPEFSVDVFHNGHLPARGRKVDAIVRVSSADGLGKEPASAAAGAAAEDYERAASLRDRERELLADKASRDQQWAAEHPDLPSLAEKVRQLSEEVERLRGLLRQKGPEQEEGTA